MKDIDFVITWVDGNDPAWLKQKREYEPNPSSDVDDSEARYRDWDLLRYWFRCVEKNAPWVRKIHFVTWGHVPEWLNTDHPKLHIVRHEDYIPAEYLPTFNSHTIELNFHRILDLSEQFVYFNDDMFLIDKVDETFFFKDGLPCDAFQMNAIYFGKNGIGWINGSNTAIINDHFKMRKVVKEQWKKVFSVKNGLKRNLKNIMLYFLVPWFPGLDYWHITSSFLKSSFNEVWEAEPGLLDETCRCRFREKTNVNQFLIKDWQLVTGRFVPMSLKAGHCFHMNDKRALLAAKAIKEKEYKVICINDTGKTVNWEDNKGTIINSFEKVYGERSSFENDKANL